jgi:hypothetical protein
MEIKTLVIFGFLLTLVSSSMFYYMNHANINEWVQQLVLFNDSKKQEIAQIDTNIQAELKNQVPTTTPSTSTATPPVPPQNTNPTPAPQTQKPSQNTNPTPAPETTQKPSPEVFVVSNNLFSTGDAPKVCRGLFNSDIATREQLEDGYNNGANWCNYGWTSDGNAYYPLQNDTNTLDCKGHKGLNGGKMPGGNDLKLGAICYGVKPEDKKYTELEKIHQDSSFSENDMKMLEDYRKKLKTDGGPRILAFNQKTWSRWDKTFVPNQL